MDAQSRKWRFLISKAGRGAVAELAASERRLSCPIAGLNQPKRELPAVALMAFDEVLNSRWNVAHLQIAAAADFKGNIFRNILRQPARLC
jgi:hypothetical protein